MKWRDFVRHLESCGCEFAKEGARVTRSSWIQWTGRPLRCHGTL